MHGKIFANPTHRIGVKLIRFVHVVLLFLQVRFATQETHSHVLVHVAVERCRVARHQEQNLGRIVELIAIILSR
uniref:Putative secreted peptide n=1 Tax=Anopheles braziliensis TaxID=58242 RepID=A0A2M3ZWZ2_9DIPT